jgi:hypothetical protein
MSHPMARGAAALPLLASWSAHGLHRQATRVEVRRRRDYAARGVFACGASRRPLLRLCLPPTSGAVGPQRPRVAVARGLQLRSRDEARGDWWLSATTIGILRAAVRLPALVAHLHLRVRARSSPLVQHATQPPRCARATQGSEPLLCAQQARRGFSAVAPTGICAAFSGGAAAPR